MQVLKRGQPPQEVKYTYKCTACDSVLLIERSDRQACQRDGDYVICPVCDAVIAWDNIENKGIVTR